VYLTFFVMRVRSSTSESERSERYTDFSKAMYDVLEGRGSLGKVISSFGISRIRLINAERPKDVDTWEWLAAGTAMATFFGASYLRFYDAIKNAGIALSDAYVTLAWTKYIEARQLFHDGLYPQGFVIVLSVIRKVASIDPLLVLKFIGPLNAVLIVVGLYYFASRSTRSPVAGLVAAFVYGVLPNTLPIEYQRQASTNSQ